MSGNLNISNLSYKELQALALRYRVPGNIKKQLLIEVLQAARCGNEQEVDKLLADLRQNRKKRIRKNKPTKLTMSIASTPIHSPTYDMADDYYAVQHRLPYQWVGAEEEIPNRQLDEVNRVPHYEEFRQFLLRRIQRDYQTYGTNHNERVDPLDPGGIMDLRNDQGDSVRFETNDTTVGVRSNNVAPMNSLEAVQIAHNPPAGFDYQILEDPNGNGNNNASILLRRMLQAPVGADLGEIASPELGTSCRIWGNDHYNQNDNNLLDNSDTVSANSDVNGNDNDNDDNNWPIGTEYYRFVNNVRDQLILNSGNRQNFDQPSTAGQFCSVLTDNNPLQYQLLYANQMPDVQHQHGQQQWETPGPGFDGNALNYHQKPRTLQGSRIFHPGTNAYYDGIGAANYTTTRIPENSNPQQQQYVNADGSGYSAGNQIGFENNGSCTPAPYTRSDIKFYENLNNNNNTAGENPIAEAFSSVEHFGKQISDPNDYTLAKSQIHHTNYYPSSQHTPEFMPPMQHSSFSNSHNQQEAPLPLAHNGYVENLGCSSSSIQTQVQPLQLLEEFNRPSIFAQYPISHRASSLVDENQELVCQSNRNRDEIKGGEAGGETDPENKTIIGSTSTTQSDSTMSLDAFWPQKSVAKRTADNCLENILNLNTHGYGYVDYSKVNQTSCIYCYSAPIVTQKLYTANSPCSQKKRFIAEFRQHLFSPYWLLYNDANTGMQMSKQGTNALDKIQRPSVSEKPSEEMNELNYEKRIKDIAVDLENDENPLQTALDRSINDNSEFQLPAERHLNSEVAEEANKTDQFYGKEISSFDSENLPNIKSGAGSSSTDFNDQDEREPSENLNMENASC